MRKITACPWLLSVTESVALPPQPSRRSMDDTPKFELRIGSLRRCRCRSLSSWRSPWRRRFIEKSFFNSPAAATLCAWRTGNNMANTATIRNANGLPATFAGSKTGQDDAPFVFVKVGDEERRMRWAEWDALPRLDRSPSRAGSQRLIARLRRSRHGQCSVCNSPRAVEDA